MLNRYQYALRLAAVTLLTVLWGCTPELYGYQKISDSEQYIPRTALEAIVERRLDREHVIQQLGQPDGTNGKTNTIGYERCVRSKGWGVFGSAGVADCQRSVIWFDEQDRAKAEYSLVKYSAYNLNGFVYSLQLWLAAPPPPPFIE